MHIRVVKRLLRSGQLDLRGMVQHVQTVCGDETSEARPRAYGC